jgi:Tol biopolymer transport system component
MYHIALFGVGIEAEFPSLMLYHSETGAVETVPFSHLWSPAFSPDGRWLLLDQRPDRNGYESNALYIRTIDPVNSEIRYIGEGSALWTTDWTKVAFGLNKSISVFSFPDGVQLGTWNVRQYDLFPRAWSPDGRYIAVEGYAEGWHQALFIINVER